MTINLVILKLVSLWFCYEIVSGVVRYVLSFWWSVCLALHAFVKYLTLYDDHKKGMSHPVLPNGVDVNFSFPQPLGKFQNY